MSATPNHTTPRLAGSDAVRTWQVARHDLTRTLWVHEPARPLLAGEVRFAVDRVALTANNITYGAFGDAMHYWDFFPTSDPAWGCIPVWGFAEVTETTLPEIQVGERYYGYWPMANQVVLQPGHLSRSGFTDMVAHRQHLHALYNRYLACATDALYRPEHEGWLAVLRPLFMTSFLIDDMLGARGYAGGATIVMSSASSKTALGTAWCLARRPGAQTIGLTSAAKVPMLRSLGVYGQVLPYDDLATLPAEAAVYVDFSGSKPLRHQVHAHWGDRLQLSSAIGATDWQHLGDKASARTTLPGPRPELFFAPAQAATMQERVGREAFGTAVAHAWGGFLSAVTQARPPWLMLRDAVGPAAIEAVYREVLAGSSAPDHAWLLRWRDPA